MENQKGFSMIAIAVFVAVVVAVVVGGAAVYQQMRQSKNQNQFQGQYQTQSESQNQANQPAAQESPQANQIAGWKTYTGTIFGYQIEYPTYAKVSDSLDRVNPANGATDNADRELVHFSLQPDADHDDYVSIEVVAYGTYNPLQKLNGPCWLDYRDYSGDGSKYVIKSAPPIIINGINFRKGDVTDFFRGFPPIVSVANYCAYDNDGTLYSLLVFNVTDSKNQTLDQIIHSFKLTGKSKLVKLDNSLTPNFTLCSSDSDCPSLEYVCQKGLGYEKKIISDGKIQTTVRQDKGLCGLKEGNQCFVRGQYVKGNEKYACLQGLLCYHNVCMKPHLSQKCSGPSDTSCPQEYQCVQGCGEPVGYVGQPPPSYFCALKGVVRICPICLAENTKISTPVGDINVKDVKVGDIVWSLDKNGKKVAVPVIKTSSAVVPENHQVIHLVLSNRREVWVSPSHPTANNSPVRDLKVGDSYDNSTVRSIELVPYWADKTYDILPGSDTSYYWANGILLGSTLKH